MKTLYLSFLWHMHQPYYKDHFQDQYLLPWVFLHGIKDYHEMPSYLEEYPEIKAVFNFVPSLLIQIEDYAEGRAKDAFLELIRMDTRQMTQEQKELLLPQLFMANAKHMIQPLERYKQLHDYYRKYSSANIALQHMDTQDILDLKVLFLLSWTSNSIRKESTLIQDLLGQGQKFSEDQKNSLLDELLIKMRDIIGVYKKFIEKKQIEISATPFYHPILPLLLEPESAKQAKPSISMPSFTIPFMEDAHWHVKQGISHVRSVFGQEVTGMWPAEGSVSKESAKTFAEYGIKWIASDEDVLFPSIGKDPRRDRTFLYKPHRVSWDNDKTITLFCRDKGLSDLIGFTYSTMDGEKAAEDFLGKLKDIYGACDFNPHVSVILDGENAWEFYPENASIFFNALYKKLENCNWIKTLTFTESLDHKSISYETLNGDAIRAGSWIYGDFTTWMGHEEKNRGWELLSRTWQEVADKKSSISKQKWETLLNELRIAQGSDWFWWYGDDHFSAQADIFDQLFRLHLINIYKLADLSIPQELYRPIKQSFKTGLINSISGYISPKIDGKQSSFFEWMGAACFDLTYDMGSMHTDKRCLKNLFWGFDKQFLYIRLTGDLAPIMGCGIVLQTEINTPDSHCFQYELTNLPISIPEKAININQENLECAAKDYIEIKIPFAALKITPPCSINLQFRLLQKDNVVEQAPLYNYVDMEISNDFLDDWMV